MTSNAFRAPSLRLPALTLALGCCGVALLAPTGSGQAPANGSAQAGTDPVLARYRFDGKPAVVLRSDVAIEMGLHLRHQEVGRQACKVLVDSELTRREAERLKLLPKPAEVQAFWDKLQAQLRAAGRDPAKFAAVRNSTTDEWLRDLSTQLAQERLVRHALELDETEPVSGDMLQLWLAQHRKQRTIVTDPTQLPPGVAARVDGRDLPILELGLLLLRTSENAERDRYVRQVVYLNSIEQLGRKHEIEVHPSDLDRAIAQRRKDARSDPRFRGLSLEQLLETQGLTVATLRQSRVFRAKVLQDLLANALHPKAKLAAELADNRAAVVAKVGARRKLGVIYRRALAEPNALVPHDFAAATESLERVRKRLEKERFDVVARIETDDPSGKQTGGDTGWHHQAGRGRVKLPAPVLEAAFKAAMGDIVGPVRADDGCYLVKVLDVEPALPDEDLITRLRKVHSDDLANRVLEEAAIEWGPGKAAGSK